MKSNRREFITHLGRGLAAAAVAPQLARLVSAAEPPNESKPTTAAGGDAWPDEERIGFALVGLGSLSVQQLIPAFRACKRAKLTALVSGDAAKAQKLASEHGVKPEAVYDYKNFDRIAEQKDVQVVYIVLPNSMHLEFTARAAKAGKHVLCEKPMEVSVAKSQAMIEACTKAKVKLMIGYRVQYEPMNRRMQQLVREKTFGSVQYLGATNAMRVTQPGWRLNKQLSGSGAVGDLGIYCINTARFLLGEEPVEVFAESFRPKDDPLFAEIDATTTWQMRFPSGVLMNGMCSFRTQKTQGYRIMATDGAFGMNPAFSYQGLSMFAEPENPALVELPASDQFANELDHMADCVRNNKQPYTPGEEGLQDMRVIEAIAESVRTGRSVKLPKVEKPESFRGPAPV